MKNTPIKSLFLLAVLALIPGGLQAQAVTEKVVLTPEQQKLIEADLAVPTDKPGVKNDLKPSLPDGKPNANFGKPAPSFMARHALFLERKKQPMDVLFIGDSITQGWEGKGGAVWKPLFADPYQAANFGISGDRTQHVLWRIEQGELDGITPRAIVLMIGTNNSGKNTAAEIAAGVARIIEQIQARIPGVKIVLLNLLPRSEKPDDTRRSVMIQTNELLAKMDNGTTIYYLKLWEPLLDENNILKKDLMPDFLHPNEAGYEIMGKAIKDKLVEILPAKS